MTRRIFCKVLLVVVAIFGLLVLSGVLLAQGNSDWAFEHVREVQERNTDWLMAMDDVEGTAIGYNQNERLAIKVFTAGPDVPGIPRTLDGVPVQVVITGKFYALPKPITPPGQEKKEEEVDPTDWFPRPVPIGVSTGHPDISAGTIGCRVKDNLGNVYALSNNHVYADNDIDNLDDNVLQPGAYDGGVDPYPDGPAIDNDAIGTLFAFKVIEGFFDRRDPPEDIQTNTIDAAIALSDTELLDNATPADDPDGYGTPSSITATAYVGLEVQKYGRTTGLTKGKVSAVSATVNVTYGSDTARFVNQIVIIPDRGWFSKGGDSGSLIVTQDGNNPVGLLFAGGGRRTIANQIDLVLDAFSDTDITFTIDGE